MNPQLHKMMLELDRREFVTENYFKWNEEEKQKLTNDLELFFDPVSRMTIDHKSYLMFGIIRAIEEAEYYEEYENADILGRLYDRLGEKYFK